MSAFMKQYGLQVFWVFIFVALFVTAIYFVYLVKSAQNDIQQGFSTILAAESTQEIAGETIAAMATQVAQSEQRALGYLGIFESIGLAITVLGIVGTALGAALGISVNNARDEFQKAQQSLQDLEKRNAELSETIRKTVTDTTQKSNIAQFHVVLARTQAALGDFTGAIETYERARELIPENPVPYYHIGYILTQRNRFDEAEDILNKALQLDANFPNALAALGFVYRRRWDKLHDDMQKNPATNTPENEKLLKQYSDIAQEKIMSALHAAPSLVDDDGESWHGSLGGLFRRQKDLLKAAYHYNEATKITRQSAYPLMNLILVKWEQGNVANLTDELKRAQSLVLSKIKKDKDSYWDRADILSIELALGAAPETIDERLYTFLQVLPRDAKDVLPRVIGSIEFIANAPSVQPEKRDIARIQGVLDALKAEAKKLEIESQ